MAIRELPLDSTISSFTQKMDLDGRPFTFRFRFNDRTDRWGFDISDDAGTVLIAGIPLFVKQLLIDRYQSNPALPQGSLFAINQVNPDDPPTRDNLGTDVLLLYDEVAV